VFLARSTAHLFIIDRPSACHTIADYIICRTVTGSSGRLPITRYNRTILVSLTARACIPRARVSARNRVPSDPRPRRNGSSGHHRHRRVAFDRKNVNGTMQSVGKRKSPSADDVNDNALPVARLSSSTAEKQSGRLTRTRRTSKRRPRHRSKVKINSGDFGCDVVEQQRILTPASGSAESGHQEVCAVFEPFLGDVFTFSIVRYYMV